ncbi:double zinc ribbon and ankyrin repeat-containing protein 1 isoform X2 [Hyperolius riggenbachi]|uniref:double zinc ribbon and ankyrin repeat-containing protein 1 isoform X2 n=1 Tax=Hyperolius riggenbachi TaxID=752182 RepID=UPI0035A328D4
MTAGSICVPQIIPLRVPLPGKGKYEVDTNTPIEIKSDSPDVSIFYTLDGSKPELYKKVGHLENTALKYRGPFTLPDGKITVKSVAVSRDGRESGIVTKVFTVEYVPLEVNTSDEDNDENFLRELSKQDSVNVSSPLKPKKKDGMSQRPLAWNDTTEIYKEYDLDGRPSHRSLTGPRFMNTRLGKPIQSEDPLSSPQTLTPQVNGTTEPAIRKSLTSTQSMRIQRETDFLKCAQCLAPRPSDPFARFCQECGTPVPPVPGRRLPPPEGAQMGLCVECRTMVPMNTPSCIVCEAPLLAQMQPQASIHLKDKTICRSCGTGNPINLKHCVTCEARLPQTQTPGPSVSYLTCSKCSASNHPYAQFCATCGVYLEPPGRFSAQQSRMLSSGEHLTLSGGLDGRTSWQPLSVSLPQPRLDIERTDKGTQTVGLFYPSSKLMEKKELEIISEKETKEKMSDRKPLVTAVSPGRGYWRQQLDHICAHLRCYTQNDSEFKALIGKPRMGRIISATVHEDGYEVSLRLNYVLVTDKPVKLSTNHFLSSVTEGRGDHGDTQSSVASEDGLSARSNNSKHNRSKKKRNRKPIQKEDRLPLEDRKLFKEVGPKGEGKIAAVEELLDEGADPNCCNNEDRPVLTVAVLNGHHQVVPVLVQKGADIDQQSGPQNNTALHEAVQLGMEGKKSAEVLLGCNASIKKKNDKGMTAYDLALKGGNEQISSLFASKLGQGMLDKLTKPKNISLDVF